MRNFLFGVFLVGTAFAATIPSQLNNNVADNGTSTPASDAFDSIFDQARSAVAGLFNLFTIPFSILSNTQSSSSTMSPISSRSGSGLIDPLQGVFQATNRAFQRATDSIINAFTSNAQEPNSDPLLRIFHQGFRRRTNSAEAANETNSIVGNRQSQPLQLLRQFFMPSRSKQ